MSKKKKDPVLLLPKAIELWYYQHNKSLRKLVIHNAHEGMFEQLDIAIRFTNGFVLESRLVSLKYTETFIIDLAVSGAEQSLVDVIKLSSSEEVMEVGCVNHKFHVLKSSLITRG